MSGKRVVASMYVGAPQQQTQPKAAGSVYAPDKPRAASVYAGAGGGGGGAAPSTSSTMSAMAPAKSIALQSQMVPGAETPQSGPVSDVVASEQPQQDAAATAMAPAQSERAEAEGRGGAPGESTKSEM